MRLARAWFGPPATEQELASVGSVAPAPIANDLDRFYRKHNGAERAFDEVDYAVDRFDSLNIYDIAIATNPDVRSSLDERFPDYWAIGGDSGGQTIAYDMKTDAPWAIVLFLPGDADSPTLLAKSLDDLCETYFNSTHEQQAKGEQGGGGNSAALRASPWTLLWLFFGQG